MTLNMGFPSRPRRNWLPCLYLLLWLVKPEPIDHVSKTLETNSSSSATMCRWNPPGPLRPRMSASCPPAVNTTTTTAPMTRRPSTPWTQTPYCVASVDKDNATSQRYCTFTSATFRAGRGLSFVGTPDAAAALADALLSEPWHSPFPSHVDVLADTNRSSTYAVVPMPGKGLGVVATRHIPAGEILMADYPLLIADVAAGHGELLRLAVERLPLPEMFFDLARSHGGGDAVEDVLNTNTFAVGVGDGDYMGLYPEIAVSGPPSSLRTLSAGLECAVPRGALIVVFSEDKSCLQPQQLLPLSPVRLDHGRRCHAGHHVGGRDHDKL